MSNQKKKVFNKEKNKPSKDIERQSQEYLDGWKRCQADFENYKKQQEKRRKNLILYSTENIIMQILPVLDNFQASMEHIPSGREDCVWVQGIKHIQKQLEKVLTDNGVEEIKMKTGDKFNPNFCEAVAENEEGEKKQSADKNRIEKIILKGYKIGDKIIRPARVIVE